VRRKTALAINQIIFILYTQLLFFMKAIIPPYMPKNVIEASEELKETAKPSSTVRDNKKEPMSFNAKEVRDSTS